MDQSRQDIVKIILAAVDSVRPKALFPSLFSQGHPALKSWLESPDRFLFCVGKAGASSAQAILQNAGCRDYFVIAPEGGDHSNLDPEKVHAGSHPVPNENSLNAGEAAREWLGSLRAGSRLLVVISGGASALMVSPLPGVSLESKMKVNRILIGCGASIAEINTIRKHLSRVKGGRLAESVAHLKTEVLAISDVAGDDFSTIGSGPFYPDHTTYIAARQILERYAVWDTIPDDARRAIEKGCSGEIPETPESLRNPVPHHIIASNSIACEGAAEAAKRLGYSVNIQRETVSGDVEEMAERIAMLAHRQPARSAFIAGGEVTVRLQGSGKGGRNQHLALLVTKQVRGLPMVFAAAGTDGVDGNSEAAGAWTDGETAEAASKKNLKIEEYIQRFDSYFFFKAMGQSIVTGPTGTNVMDLYILLS